MSCCVVLSFLDMAGARVQFGCVAVRPYSRVEKDNIRCLRCCCNTW